MTKEIARNWLVKEVADLTQISECSTLRKSCFNYIESKLAPVVAFLLSKMDLYDNLNIIYNKLSSDNQTWLRQMWLSILVNEELFKLSYEDMRTDDAQRTEFECKQWSRQSRSQDLKPKLPFFWLVIDKINDLCHSFFESKAFSKEDKDVFLRTVPSLFEATPHHKIFSKYSSPNILDAYINDFLLLNSEVHDQNQMDIIKGLRFIIFRICVFFYFRV